MNWDKTQAVYLSLLFLSFSETAPKATKTNYEKDTDLDLELKISGEKIKQISESWALASHRKSGGAGGIEDYLDPKTLQHLEALNIIDPPEEAEEYTPEPFQAEAYSMQQKAEIFEGLDDLTSGRKSGPDYLEISKQVRKLLMDY